MLPMLAVVADYLSKSSLDALLLTTTDAHSSEYIGESDLILRAVTGFTGSFGMALVHKSGGFLFTDPRYHLQAPNELHSGFVLLKTMDEFVKIFHDGSSVGVDTRNVSEKTFKRLSDKLKGVKFVPDLNFVDSIWEDRPSRVFRDVEDIEALLIGPYIDDNIRLVVTVPEKLERTNVTGSFRQDKLHDVLNQVGDDTVVLTALDEIAWVLNMRGADIPYNPVFYSFLIMSKKEIILFSNAKIDFEGFVEERIKDVNIHKNSGTIRDSKQSLHVESNDTKNCDISKNSEKGDIITDNFDQRLPNSDAHLVNEKDQKPSLPRIRVKNYENFYEELQNISGTVHVSPSASVYVRSVLSNCVIKDFEHIRERKSIKNEIEILGERIAHLYDGIALVKLFDALELRIAAQNGGNSLNDSKENKICTFNTLEAKKAAKTLHAHCVESPLNSGTPNPKTNECSTESDSDIPILTEIHVDMMLNKLKKSFAAFRGPSFATIAGSGLNGAIIHHSASQKVIEKDALLLTDTGSQYSLGTTDISRTISLGIPTNDQKRDFTTVLKAQIAGMSQKIHKNTPASAIDTITRFLIWQTKNDFSHATGHGVGHFSNVHEDPPSISAQNEKPIRPGQIFSIEPGIYRENEYGIRIEDLVLAKQDGDWIFFENLTLTPLQLKMIDRELLSATEVTYINEFNQKVRRILKNFIKEGELGYRFLIQNTEEL